jgi:FkbM family methyltransferase
MNDFTIDYRAPWRRLPDKLHFPDIKDHITDQVRRSNSFYEAGLLEYLYYAVPHGGIFLDLGANIGNHTLFFAKYLADRVVAIEPQPETFDILQWTIAKNGLKNVECIASAVGSKKGVAELSLPDGYERNRGSFTLVPCAKASRNVRVPVESLDGLLADCLDRWDMPVRLMKIDVEGYEQEALQGAMSILEAHHPDVVVEAQTDDALQKIRQQLSPLKYRVFGCFNATPTYHFTCRGRLRHTAARLNRKARGIVTRILFAKTCNSRKNP